MHESELLDIAQAADFLRVSPTSLRRWTNAGRLPCYRVGGRRERRFLRADLLGFLERVGSPAAQGGGHAHLCGLYSSAPARERQAATFLAQGLAAGSVCLLVAEPPVRPRILGRLTALRPDVPRELSAGRLVLSGYASSARAQLAFWEQRFGTAVRDGAASIRVVGDVSGGKLGRRRWAEVVTYEREYDRLARRFPVTTLCLYDARRLSGQQTSGVLQLHGDVLRHPVEALVG